MSHNASSKIALSIREETLMAPAGKTLDNKQYPRGFKDRNLKKMQAIFDNNPNKISRTE